MSKLAHSDDYFMSQIEWVKAKDAGEHEMAREGARSMTACPKCGLEAKTMLHPFCKHKDCAVR